MIQTVVGISFNPTANPDIVKGSPVTITHDTDNQYSSRAIVVKFGDQVLGHIGEKVNIHHEKIFDVLPLEGKVAVISKLQAGEEFAKFEVGEITHLEIEFPMLGDDSSSLQSYNEGVDIKFIQDSHRYVHNGRDLISATNYIKRWIAPFDKERIACAVAKKLGLRAEEVLDYWTDKGEISAAYGSAIHNALEHFEKFQEMGKIFQNHKELDYNPALPTHPQMRKIVEDFYKQKLREGIVVPEVLVTNVELGFAGYIDRLLITGTNTCYVQDYKINIDSDVVDKNIKYLGQFAELPKNKLSKYQLQLSFYARLLELSGWAVLGLDVYVFENEWKHYELPVLKLNF